MNEENDDMVLWSDVFDLCMSGLYSEFEPSTDNVFVDDFKVEDLLNDLNTRCEEMDSDNNGNINLTTVPDKLKAYVDAGMD